MKINWHNKTNQQMRTKEHGARRSSSELRSVSDSQDLTFRSGTTLNTFKTVERDKTDRQKEKELQIQRRKLGALLIIILAICAFGFGLISQFNGSIISITSNVSSLKANDSEKYESIVNDYLAINPFERFSFARRSDNLNNYIRAKSPEVKSVDINQSGLLVSSLKITFRQPVVMWVSGNDTSYVDSDGSVFAINYFEQPKVAIDDKSGVQIEGDAVTSSRFLSFVGQTTAYITEKGGGEVERVVVPAGAIRYVDFYLVGREYPFKAQIDRDANSQAADIVAMTNYLDQNNIKPSYVDARVAGKSYWK